MLSLTLCSRTCSPLLSLIWYMDQNQRKLKIGAREARQQMFTVYLYFYLDLTISIFFFLSLWYFTEKLEKNPLKDFVCTVFKWVSSQAECGSKLMCKYIITDLCNKLQSAGVWDHHNCFLTYCKCAGAYRGGSASIFSTLASRCHHVFPLEQKCFESNILPLVRSNGVVVSDGHHKAEWHAHEWTP